MSIVLTLIASTTTLAGAAVAGTIPNVGGGSAVTISVFVKEGTTFRDVTDSYLPTWTPSATVAQRTVYIVVNGSTTTPTLVPPTSTAPSLTNPNPYLDARTTSAFPGNCTNYGNATGPDFDFNTLQTESINGGTGYSLTALDCGGMAVIGVGNDRFIVPKDADATGLPTGVPDALDVFGLVLTPGSDPDGDGLTTFDETVRGFIIGGQHVRLNPTVKDVFVHLVKGQCGTSLLTTAGGFPVASAGGLDANLNTLIRPPQPPPPGIANNQVHLLGNSLSPAATAVRTDEWVDHFVSFTLGTSGTTETWTYCSTALTPSGTCAAPATTVVVTASNGALAPGTDRSVTKNQIYGDALVPMKGLRLTECATTSGTSPHGTGRYGLGAAQGKDEAVVYTDRIRRFVNSTGGKSPNIFYSTFVNGAWAAPAQQNVGGVTVAQARNFISSKIMQYILAMEIGHTLRLIDDALLQTVATFPHYSAGFGDNMDEAVQAINSGGVKFYIPSSFQNASQGGFELIPPPNIN